MKTAIALLVFSSAFSSPVPLPDPEAEGPTLATHPGGGTSYVGSGTVWGWKKISKRSPDEGFGTLQDEVEEAIGKVRDLEEPAFAFAFDRDAEAAVNAFIPTVEDLEEP